MTTIPIEAEVSSEQLLRAVAQLPPAEFAEFVGRLLSLRAQREGSHLSRSETALLLQINADIPADIRGRFDELIAKRQKEAITPAELAELIQITDRIEQHDAQRLAALDALAHLRQVTLFDLMDSLGIPPPTYA